METKQNHRLFAVQELVDPCIGLLESASDLRASALVSRSWAYPAQSHIFSEITLSYADLPETERLCSRFQDTLHTSPHLTRHVRRLYIHADRLSIEKFAEICTFAFTHLESVLVTGIADLTLSHAIALQQLISLPTITSVKLGCRTELSVFFQIWDRCSPSIRDLFLIFTLQSTETFTPISHPPSSHIRLESLRIPIADGALDWLRHEMCPFELSGLKGLSINDSTEALGWDIFVPVLSSIGLLEFVPTSFKPLVDLSSLSNLVEIRITLWTDIQRAPTLDTLSTITASHRIRRIVIICDILLPLICAQLDAKLSGLPLRHSFDVIIVGRPNDLQLQFPTPNFPRLASQNMVHHRMFAPDKWWKSFMTTTGYRPPFP
ncbi:hypothetical protein B0H17DRAFT_1328937 [Mycena rosella]|uniref:Uncharacterized protein n=1 Tax=Mycena rosella TaxID=1033263 RepID=A0AAD7DQB5_MYCRO|nr:hypothetical protein B0H17DRAFT_1328937 [Mycena rosella]